MSILINMEMPKNCAECPCRMIGYTKDYCNVLGKFIDFAVGSEGRRDDCPLTELPKHGDLIDRDELIKVQQSNADLFKGPLAYTDKCRRDEALNAVANIVNAPTIVEASEVGT